MQHPSAREIEREAATLRDIRRRSAQAGPGAIPLDPDLPPNGPGGSASAGGYWDNYSGPPQRRPSARLRQQEDASAAQDVDDVPDDPSHLFWVPAHLHPEIAPAEFRAFLKEHTAASPDGTMPLVRSLSSSSSLGRKKSLLSKQYTPSANDHVEDERPPVTVKRNRSSIYSTAGPQLTISDLQKLEQLAEEAAASDDPSKLRKVLRRSLSLNIAPSCTCLTPFGGCVSVTNVRRLQSSTRWTIFLQPATRRTNPSLFLDRARSYGALRGPKFVNLDSRAMAEGTDLDRAGEVAEEAPRSILKSLRIAGTSRPPNTAIPSTRHTSKTSDRSHTQMRLSSWMLMGTAEIRWLRRHRLSKMTI